MDSSRVTAILLIFLSFYVFQSNPNSTWISEMSSSEIPNTVATPSSSTDPENTKLPYSEAADTVTTLTSSESTKSRPMTALPSSVTTDTVTSLPSSESTQNMTSLHSSESTQTVTPHSSESTHTVTSSHSSESTQHVISHSSESTQNVTSPHSSESTQTVTLHSSESTHTVTSSHSSESTQTVTPHSSESTHNVTSPHSSVTPNTITSALSSENTKKTTSLPISVTTDTLPISNITSAPPASYSDWISIWICVAVIVVLVLGVILAFFFHRFIIHKHSEGYEDFSNRQYRRGLRNLGNTCYFNSTIQCLTSTPILKSNVEASIDKKVTTEFLRFLKDIYPENNSGSDNVPPVNPKPLLDAFCAKVTKYQGNRQHDSHELLRNFLDQLRKEERAENPNKKLTAVDRIFGGHFMTIYICKNCNEPYHVCEPFLDISVPISRGEEPKLEISKERQRENTELKSATPYQEAAASIMKRLSPMSADLPAQILSITDGLQYFTRQEMLGEQYLCRSCSHDASSTNPDLSPATKQTLILNPPAVLVLHLKRFEMKSSGFKKRTNKIAFEEVLDLGPYCSSWCQRNEDREQNIWYSLYAVVVHSGSLTSGHYVAYVKNRNDNLDIDKFLQEEYLDKDMTADQLVEMTKKLNQKEVETAPKESDNSDIHTIPRALPGSWYCLNDSIVSTVGVGEVLRQEAYLLFYERFMI